MPSSGTPNPYHWVDGEFLGDEHMNHHNELAVDAFEWEKWSTPQSIADGSAAADFAGDVTVTGWETTPNIGSAGPMQTWFDPSTGVFTPQESAWYLISWQAQFAGNATGYRRGTCSIVHSVDMSPNYGASVAVRLAGAGITYLDGPANTNARFFTAKLVVKQTSTASLNLVYAAFHILKYPDAGVGATQ